MNRKKVYPVYIRLTEESCSVKIPDFNISVDSPDIASLASAMEYAREKIEKSAKTIEDKGKKINEPYTVEYKKEKGESAVLVDVNLDRYARQEKLDKDKDLDRIHTDLAFEGRENLVEFLTGDSEVSVTFSQKKYINKVLKYAEEYPDEVKIIYQNADGSVYAKIPRKYLHLYRTTPREMSEEQRKAASDRLKTLREKKD